MRLYKRDTTPGNDLMIKNWKIWLQVTSWRYMKWTGCLDQKKWLARASWNTLTPNIGLWTEESTFVDRFKKLTWTLKLT
jgi:hypothetical protein